MNGAKVLLALAIKAAVIGFSCLWLTSYLITHSQGTLPHKMAALPTLFVAGSLLIGLLVGLWLGGGKSQR